MENYPGRRFAETRDLIVSQSNNGHISVIEKATGAKIVHVSYLKYLKKEQLEFIASDCQHCFSPGAAV